MNIPKIVREGREQSRLTTLDFATGILMTLSNYTVDRSFAMMVQLLVLAGLETAVTVVGIQKGKSLQDNLSEILANRIQKATARLPLRFMKQAEKFGRPA